MNQIPVKSSGRVAAVSRALRQAARSFRAAGSAATARGNVVLVQRRWEGIFGPAVKLGFLILVIIPVVLAGLYLGFIASDRYVATTQFTVRNGQQPDLMLGGLTTLTQQPGQNTDIVANYIGSNDMIAALGRRFNLRAVYDWPQADIFSRISTAEPAEKFNRYWNNHISVNVDNGSNIVTVSVEAFTPQDALMVASGVLAESENLVNAMSDRSRRDALRDTVSELKGYEQELDAKTRAVRALRDKSGLIDPKTTNDAASQTLQTMHTQLANMRIEYSSDLRYVRSDAPQMQILSHRIADTQNQISLLERQLAGPAINANPNLAASAAMFDKANLDLSVAQQQYAAGVLAMEKARAGLEEQLIYVLPFERPTLPQEALYPRRLLDLVMVAGICLAIWGALAGLALLARNNLAV